jgi:hypothetical protein
MIETRYAVLIEGDFTSLPAYYADKQPKYEWSFTKNFTEAKLYKTKEGAEERILHAEQLQGNLTGKLIEIRIKQEFEFVGEVDRTTLPLPKGEWDAHQYNCTKNRCLGNDPRCPVMLGKVKSKRK